MHTAATGMLSSNCSVAHVDVRCRMMLAAHFAADHCHRLHSTFQAVQAGGKRPAQQRCSTVRQQRLWLKRQPVSCQAVKRGAAAVDGELLFTTTVAPQQRNTSDMGSSRYQYSGGSSSQYCDSSDGSSHQHRSSTVISSSNK